MAARKAKAGAAPVPGVPQASSGSGAADQSATAADFAELAEGSARYPVLSPLRFDGRLYRPDDPDANEVVMPRDQAPALQALSVLGEELV